LYWALRQFEEVRAISFDYGQRHASELEAAGQIARRAGVVHSIASIPFLAELRTSALTNRALSVAELGYLGLPATFTPGRNLIFLTQAAAYAFSVGAHHLVTGVCQTDFSGYPDCRRATIDALQQALALGMEWPLHIHTPVMYLTKAQSVTLARGMKGCWEALALTVTCYLGQRPGCGTCPACVIRARGFEEAGFPDPATNP
jgi:7-cyano-7-deazaguanine synthase